MAGGESSIGDKEAQLTYACWKSVIETSEKGVEYVRS